MSDRDEFCMHECHRGIGYVHECQGRKVHARVSRSLLCFQRFTAVSRVLETLNAFMSVKDVECLLS
jgi:hypothetical protein